MTAIVGLGQREAERLAARSPVDRWWTPIDGRPVGPCPHDRDEDCGLGPYQHEHVAKVGDQIQVGYRIGLEFTPLLVGTLAEVRKRGIVIVDLRALIEAGFGPACNPKENEHG